MSRFVAARSVWTAAGALLALGVAPWAPGARGAMIEPGLIAEAEAAEWLAPWNGQGEQEIDLGGPSLEGVAAHAEASVTPDTTLTTASAAAIYGGLGVSLLQAGEYGAGAGQQIKSQATGFASFRDDSVFVSEDGKGPGDLGTFTASYRVVTAFDGLIDALAGAAGDRFELVVSYQVQVLIGDLRPGFDRHEALYTGQWSMDGDSGEVSESATVEIDDALIDFEYDQPLTIAAAVWSSVYLVGTGPGAAEVLTSLELGPTFQWLGVRDLPEPAELGSEDVMDWTEPVDIPAGGTLGLIVVAGASALNRRRSARDR